MRLDKFLKVSRLIKRRTVANEACDAGRVSLNGKPARASAEVKAGDIIEIEFGNRNMKARVKDVREVIDNASRNSFFDSPTPILFIDEIHRFSKSQQDSLLAAVEKGVVTLIGATTENPSFEVNSALLSRCKVFVLKPLSEEDLVDLIKNALHSPKGFGNLTTDITDDMIHAIAQFANGDARSALTTLEMIILNAPEENGVIHVTKDNIIQSTSKKFLLYDKQGEEHYNLISALHKSMRNSDPDAAIYYLARMLEAGEDPIYIARRVTRFASEDIGLAEPKALEICVAAYQACHFIGMPECTVHLTEAVTFCALAPKSNALYLAYNQAAMDAKAAGILETHGYTLHR